MRLLFASLLCHRDVKVWTFNWFCGRIHLDHGFDIPHLILNDGSLTTEDIEFLNSLPKVWVDKDPIHLYNVPKPQLFGKLQCLERGFKKYGADRVVVFDGDIFFYKNWDSEVRKICTSEAIAMRDWGSSLGPHPREYKQLFGVYEDNITHNCNTGIFSIVKEKWSQLEAIMHKYINTPFNIMDDQGCLFAAFYGELQYINNIKCIVNGAEFIPELWQWVLRQKGSHLQGMRVRQHGFNSLVQHSLENLPDKLMLQQIEPHKKHISFGLMEHDTYNFDSPWHTYPTRCKGVYITDAIYMHGGSWAEWHLDKRFTKFTARVDCMDTGIRENAKPVTINGKTFPMGEQIETLLEGKLLIETQDGPGAHIVFIEPRLFISKHLPDVGDLFVNPN